MKQRLTEILKAKGTIIRDIENINGRFVTLAVSDPRMTAYELAKELPAAFPKGHISKPTYWGDEYSIQANSKRPAFLHPGCIYPAGAFGDMTKITIKKER